MRVAFSSRCLSLAFASFLALPMLAHADFPNAVFLDEFGLKSPDQGGVFYWTLANDVNWATGDLYTTESYRIQRWDSSGNKIQEWLCGGCAGISVNQTTGDVYATRHTLDQVVQYTANGTFVRQWGSKGAGIGQFEHPYGIAVDSLTGNVYVIEAGNGRGQAFDSVGNHLFFFSSPGTGVGQIRQSNAVTGAAFDPNSRVLYVTDALEQKVLKFDEFGTFILQFGGIEGTAPGEFRWPRSVDVDSQGTIYVAGTDGERIQTFTPTGTYIGTFQGPHTIEAGPFHPRDIAINKLTDEKYVNASYAGRQDKFDANDNFLFSWGYRLKDSEYMLNPKGMAVSPVTGDVFVFDSDNFLVKRYSPGGAYRIQWGGSVRVDSSIPGLWGSFDSSALEFSPTGDLWVGLIAGWYPGDAPLQYVQRFDEAGNHAQSIFRTPTPTGFYVENVRDVAYDAATNEVWTSDARIDKLQKHDPGIPLPIAEINVPGNPAGLALFGTSIYVADNLNQQIHRFDTATGAPNGSWGGVGTADGQMSLRTASGLTTDSVGNVYLADSNNDRIQKFTSDGTFVAAVQRPGWVTGLFGVPIDVDFSPDESLMYVLDQGRARVLTFCIGDSATCAGHLDSDSDGSNDTADNCPFVTNPLQEDGGGLNSIAADGIGNVCQCGELNGDFTIDAADVTVLRAYFADPIGAPIDTNLCSVREGHECDYADVVALQRGLASMTPGLRPACNAATGL